MEGANNMEKKPADLLAEAEQLDAVAIANERHALQAFYNDDAAAFDRCMKVAARNRYEAAKLRSSYYKAAANRVGARTD